MQTILNSSKSAILLNGVPGNWINCKRGLRQGDPLSPYLFLLVAETLQAMIRRRASDIRHPLVPDAGCVTLQYADDTLIVLRGSLSDVQCLKEVLGLFSEATGLLINYHKSSLVPLHLDQELIDQCVNVLGCRLESFPQNYLGLPLSASKLHSAVFRTYIDRTESFLSSWQASLLNTMGRVVLVNLVLDSQLVYAMSSISIPPTVIKEIDKRRRAFMWSGRAQTSSAKCLVAWENCCTTKELGGIGIREFGTHNICLLLKLIHRLHSFETSAWGSWVRQHVNLANLKGDLAGQHWDMLRSLLPLYQALTTVNIKDGSATSFWNDVWHLDEAFADSFPALYSHCTHKEESVREVMMSGLDRSLVPRLSNQAVMELQLVTEVLQRTTLTVGNDQRKSTFDCGNGKLDSSSIYKLLKARQHHADPTSDFIWNNATPPRIQFFMWLAAKNRIQCRSNLCRKRIVDSPACEICGHQEESTDHIILHCSFARDFWSKLGLTISDAFSIKEVHTLPRLQSIPTVQYSCFFALWCWQLWKRRNAFIFRNETLSVRQILQASCLDVNAWRPRIPKKQRNVADAWGVFLQDLVIQNF